MSKFERNFPWTKVSNSGLVCSAESFLSVAPGLSFYWIPKLTSKFLTGEACCLGRSICSEHYANIFVMPFRLALVFLFLFLFLFLRVRTTQKCFVEIIKSIPLELLVVNMKGKICLLSKDLNSKNINFKRRISFDDVPDFQERKNLRQCIDDELHGKSNGTRFIKDGNSHYEVKFQTLSNVIFGERTKLCLVSDVTKLTETIEANKLLIEQFNMSFNSINDGILVLNKNDEVTIVNSAMLALLNVEDVYGSRPEDVLRLYELNSNVKRDVKTLGKSGDEVVRMQQSDGTILYLAGRSVIIYDSENEPAGTVVTLRDVSMEHMRSEREKQQSFILRSILSVAHICVFKIDEKNEVLMQFIGSKDLWPVNSKGFPIDSSEWVCSEDFHAFKETYRLFIQRPEQRDVSFTFRAGKGAKPEKTYKMTYFRFHDSENVQKIFGMLCDISESEIRKMDMLAMHGLIREFAESSESGIAIMNAKTGEMIFANGKMHALLYPQNQEVGGFDDAYVPFDFAKVVNEFTDEIIKSKATSLDKVFTVNAVNNVKNFKVRMRSVRVDSMHYILCRITETTEIDNLVEDSVYNAKILDEILDNMPEQILLSDPANGKITFVNSACENFYGESRFGINGKLEKCYNSVNNSPDEANNLEKLQAGETIVYNAELQDLNSQIHNLHVNKRQIMSDSKKPRVLTISTDVTKQTQLEVMTSEYRDALQYSMKKSALLRTQLEKILRVKSTRFDQIRHVLTDLCNIVAGDASCYVLFSENVSNSLKDILHVSKKEGNISPLLPQSGIVLDSGNPLMKTLENQRFVYLDSVSSPENRKMLGNLAPFIIANDSISSAAFCSLRTADGNNGMIVVTLNREQSFTAEEKLEIQTFVFLATFLFFSSPSRNGLSHANLEVGSELNYIQVPVLYFDTQMRLQFINETAKEYFGKLNLSVPQGSFCNCVFCGKQIIPMNCPVRACIERKRPATTELYTNERICTVMTRPVFNASGEVEGVFEVVLDITESRRHQEELLKAMESVKESERAKSFFVATMSHELRTPLNAVIGFSELLQNSKLSCEEQQDLLASIHTAGKTLLELINDVLELSRLEAGSVEILPEPNNVRKFCLAIKTIFSAATRQKGIDFSVDFARNVPEILVFDQRRLRQILLNLVGNAVKFTEKGYVHVDVSWTADSGGKETGEFSIAIADTGPGIGKHHIAKLFNPFYQTRYSDDSVGTGLGLSISQKLAERMNGKIQLESELGKGSTFFVILSKCKIAHEKTAVIENEKPQLPRLSGEILIVDDVALNLKLLGAMISRLGYKPVAVSSAKEALEKLADPAFKPFAVFTDYWMPGMNGMTLSLEIRRFPEHADLPIVLLTADIQQQLTKDSPFIGILYKPLTIEKLKTAIMNVSLNKKFTDGNVSE